MTNNLIIIIDDNPIDLYVASRLIGKNYLSKKLLQFSSAEKALEYLKEHQNPKEWPCLMLVDIYMPGMSGFDFMEAYAGFPEEMRKNCDTYIVSSSINETDISRANNDNNVVAFQEKPLTLGFLQKTMDRLHC